MESPEQVDASRLKALHSIAASGGKTSDQDPVVTRAWQLLTEKADIKEKSLTVPVHSSDTLSRFFRAIFRLNMAAEDVDTSFDKKRVSEAFDALKSLNELSSGSIRVLIEKRERYTQDCNKTGDRLFAVGQVVQHRNERWRGVVVGFESRDGRVKSRASELQDDFSPNKLTSLTTKEYPLSDEPTTVYDVILDDGDEHMLIGHRSNSSGWMRAAESELESVDDRSLMRIRSRVLPEHFTHFDKTTMTFVPDDLMAYQFALDRDQDDASSLTRFSEADIQLCKAVTSAVQELAQILERCILNETSCPSERGLGLLNNVHARLLNLIKGDVLPWKYKYASRAVQPPTTASYHLRELLTLSIEILDVMLHRQKSKDHRDKMLFSLGDIVQHKVYGFRGVVVAWDPTPTVDVSQWDGLQHIKDPMKHPFYHVIPDQSDCIEAFGGERPLRYVCQENLELTPFSRRSIDVDLEPEWQFDRTEGSYRSPVELSFKYADEFDGEKVTERCMEELEKEVNAFQLKARTSGFTDPSIAALSLDNMLNLLKIVDTLEDASVIQETIKEMRKAHENIELRRQLESGVSELMLGNGAEALQVYKRIVEKDPEYAEAHNRIATTEFMLGRTDDSLKSARTTLDLDPFHFQAMNGLGLNYFDKGDHKSAIDYFRKSLELDPWSPVTSRLSASLDRLKQANENDSSSPDE